MQLESWDKVDATLRLMAKLKIEIDEHNGRMSESIDAIKSKTEKTVAPLIDEYTALEKAVEKFAWAARVKGDLGAKKSWIGNWGRIEFRAGKGSIVLDRDEAEICADLERIGHVEAVDKTPRLRKDVLKALGADVMKKIGARIAQARETLAIKPNLEAIRDINPES